MFNAYCSVKQLNRGSKINAIILSKTPLILFWHYYSLSAETQIHYKHNHLPYICAKHYLELI